MSSPRDRLRNASKNSKVPEELQKSPHPLRKKSPPQLSPRPRDGKLSFHSLGQVRTFPILHSLPSVGGMRKGKLLEAGEDGEEGEGGEEGIQKEASPGPSPRKP